MYSKAKQLLYDDFLDTWSHQFQKITAILHYISTYPELQQKLKDIPILECDFLRESQLEWVSLIAQFDNPIETVFFKSYWVPITKDDYDCFIDLSSGTFSIFKIHFFCFEPYKWYPEIVIQDVTKLLISADDPSIDIGKELMLNSSKRWEYHDKLLYERNQLGLEGKIDPTPIDSYWLIGDRTESSYDLEETKLTIRGVNSAVIGLLPYEFEISISHFESEYFDQQDILKINNIKSFIYLLQIIGIERVQSYHVLFKSGNNCYATYESGVFQLYHNDNSLLSLFVDQFCKTKKEGKHSA
tara:strand:- start:18646 stop:19542 length:897 start_codon:yes stop_codon:yes gene_type:complete